MQSRKHIYLGTYVLLTGAQSEDNIWSAAPEVSTLCLDSWAFTWVETGAKALNSTREKIGLTPDTFERLRRWATAAFESHDIGWSTYFTSPESAQAFKSEFFANRSDVNTISLFILDEFGREMVDDTPPQTDLGPLSNALTLIKHIPECSIGYEKVLGFDIVGLDLSEVVSFHSERALYPELAELNCFGLIENEDTAYSMADKFVSADRLIDGVGCVPVKVVRH